MRIWTPYEQAQLRRYGIDVSQLNDDHRPVEYITGRVDFAGLVLQVSPDVLIPRVETEELVEHIWQSLSIRPPTSPLRLADIGTGSGAIGLALGARLAATTRAWQLVLSDVSDAALGIAQRNLEQVTPQISSQNVTLLKSNLLTDFTPGDFDLLVANLPYIPQLRATSLDSSVLDFEPHQALFGGSDGLAYIRRLLVQAPAYLAPGGQVWLEIDTTHPHLLDQEFGSQWHITILADYQDHPRFARLVLP